VAIVTGTASGIGPSITMALLEQGYCVAANSRAISKSKDLKPSAELVLVDGDISKKETAIKLNQRKFNHEYNANIRRKNHDSTREIALYRQSPHDRWAGGRRVPHL